MSNITARRAAGIQFPAFYQNLFSSRVYFDMSSLINPCDSRCLRMQDVSSFGQGDWAMSNGNITLITWTLFIFVSEKMSLVSALTLWANKSWSSPHWTLLTDLHWTSGCFHCRGSDSCGDCPLPKHHTRFVPRSLSNSNSPSSIQYHVWLDANNCQVAIELSQSRKTND